MTAERESMTLQEMGAPALGVEERRDEAPGAGASHARPTPDPEVVAKPKRRKFTAQYRLRILEEAESCTQPGEVGRLLRREGLYGIVKLTDCRLFSAFLHEAKPLKLPKAASAIYGDFGVNPVNLTKPSEDHLLSLVRSLSGLWRRRS